jgi:aryl-alcohol dehydrogenase-like predicted oxidoreductase
MKTEYLDALQFHFSPSRQTLESNGAIDELQRLQARGIVRFIGMSGTLPRLGDHIAMGVFAIFQIPYSGTEREHEAIIDEAAAAGAGIVIRGGMSTGVLAADDASAKDGPNLSASPQARAGAQGFWFVDKDERRSRLERADVSDLLDTDMSMSEFMLRFTISHPNVHTTIVGTTNIGHLWSNVEAVKAGSLPAEIYEEAKRQYTVPADEAV